MARWLLPLQSLLLAVLVTWPAVRYLDEGAVGSPHADGIKHVWTLWWMRQELLHGTPGLHTTLVNWPTGMDLWPIEPLNGLLSLALPLDPVPLSNVLAILHVTLLGLCAGWLGRLVSGRPLGGLIAGALAQACAFTSFTLEVGVGELRQLWLLPLGLALAVQARDTGKAGWFVILGLEMGVATTACFYHGFFLALAVSCYVLQSLFTRVRLLPGWLLAAGIAAVSILPARTFAHSYAPRDNPDQMDFRTYMAAARVTRLETYQDAAASPEQLVTRRADERAGLPGQVRAYTGGRYLGWTTLLLVGIGVAAAPRKALPWLLVAAPAVVLSFGTVLWHDGAIVQVGGGRLVLPLAWLNRVLGWFVEPMNFPARFLAIPMIAFAAVGSLASRWRWSALLVPVAVVDMLTGDLVTWPRELFVLPRVAGIEAATGTGAVANLTPFLRDGPPPSGKVGDSIFSRKNPEDRARAIAVQMALDAPLESIPIDRMEYWAPDGELFLQALPLTRDLGRTPTPDALRESLFLLRDVGYDRLLVTHKPENHADPALASLLAPLLGPPVDGGAASIWRIPAIEASPAEAEAWRTAQAARVAALPLPAAGAQFPTP